LVLNLIFLHSFSSEFNNHHIYPDWRLTSDHAPISVDILIFDEHILTKKQSLIKNSDEKNYFLEELINFIKSMDMSSIHNIKVLKNIVQMIAINIKNSWLKHSKNINITKHSKVWWNDNYHNNLYQSRSLEDWKDFKKTVKRWKRAFFNNKITKITNKKCGVKNTRSGLNLSYLLLSFLFYF